MNILSIISLLLGIVEPALQASGVIPQNYQGLANGILAAIVALKNDLTNASGNISVTAATLTAAIASGLQALVTAGALPASWGGIASALAGAAAAGVQAGQAAAQGAVDPTKLQPVAPLPTTPLVPAVIRAS